MAGVSGTVFQSINFKQTGVSEIGTPCLPVSARNTATFSEGTAATDQLDVLFQSKRTLLAGANEDLDLAGVLEDSFGDIVNMAQLCVIYVASDATNTGDIEVSASAASGLSGPFLAGGDGVSVAPGEVHMSTSPAGWAVADGATDLLNVSNPGAADAIYNIVLVGRSVAV